MKAPDLDAGLLLGLQVAPKVAEACLERRHQSHLCGRRQQSRGRAWEHRKTGERERQTVRY